MGKVMWDAGGSPLSGKVFIGAFLILQLFSVCAYAYLVDSNPYRHIETLDGEGKYVLEWMVDWHNKRVIFNVTAETNGYVGFGLSRRGKMTGADIVIGGIAPNGKPYFSDRHAIGNQLPEVDASQDWSLHAAYETSTHTFLSFSRLMDTCDKEDYPITEDVIGLIWSYGENDNYEEYHFHHRGHFDAFLLDPDLTPRVAQPIYRNEHPKELGDLKVWPIPKFENLPPKESFYTCSFHKAPRFPKKQHIVGFNTVLHSELEKKHIQSFIIYRCHPPAGRDAAAFFERFVRNRGQECYTLLPSKPKIPTENCREPVHVWSINGKAVFLPEHVGIPFAENSNEYYMVQTHYENPEKIPGIKLRFGLEIFYSGKTRKHDAGAMIIGQKMPASPGLLIPPSAIAHSIYGICGSGCTKQMLPNIGVQVFGASIHTNGAGRGVRLQHTRDDQELPWISFDDNYNYKFQQTRILRKERNVLPGDQLITRCIYDTTGKKYAVTGGISMKHEICFALIWYYNRIPGYGLCESEIKSDAYLGRLGVSNVTWSEETLDLIVHSPKTLAGLSLSDVATKHIKWTLAKRSQLQHDHRFLPQINQCPRLIPGMKKESPVAESSEEVSKKKKPTLTRYTIQDEKQKEVIDDSLDSEYVTIYGKDVDEYLRPPMCERQAPRKSQQFPSNDYPVSPIIGRDGQQRGTYWNINSQSFDED